jgi:hypothetical protein
MRNLSWASFVCSVRCFPNNYIYRNILQIFGDLISLSPHIVHRTMSISNPISSIRTTLIIPSKWVSSSSFGLCHPWNKGNIGTTRKVPNNRMATPPYYMDLYPFLSLVQCFLCLFILGSARVWIQGIVFARQVLYHLSYISSPVILCF